MLAGRWPTIPRVTETIDPAPSSAAHRPAWTEPGAHEVAPNVYRVPLPLPNDGLRAVNVYLIVGASSVDMIDSGWHRGDAWEQLGRALRQVGAGIGDVRRVLATHLHHDHYGQAALLREASGAVVFLGEAERPSLETIIQVPQGVRENWARTLTVSGAQPLMDELLALGPRAVDDAGDRWEYPDTWVPDDMRIGLTEREVRAIATPGHTAGHVSFVDEVNGLFFAGDHVLPRITPSIGLEPVRRPLPLRDFMESLVRVRDLAVTQVLPAHGEPFADLAGRVDELLAHHRHRLDAAFEAVAGGATTAFDVAQLLPWTRREVAYASLDFFNRQLAVRESLAHLDLLVADGRLVRVEDAGVRRFSVAAPALT